MSVNHSVNVNLRYALSDLFSSSSDAERDFTALSANDDDFEIVSYPKELLSHRAIENILGYRYLYDTKIQTIVLADRSFLYKFIQSQFQWVTINGVEHAVHLLGSGLPMDYLNGYVDNTVVEMSFADKLLTRPTWNSGRNDGMTDTSVGYRAGVGTSGTVVTLRYHLGAQMAGRKFAVKSVSSFGADIIFKDWEFIDRNRGVRNLGYKLNYSIDFGSFGIGQTQAELADCRNFIREFVTADSKEIEVENQYIGNVVNDFSEVRYNYIDSVFMKSTQLNFKSNELLTNIPVRPSTTFILDDTARGTLDANPLG